VAGAGAGYIFHDKKRGRFGQHELPSQLKFEFDSQTRARDYFDNLAQADRFLEDTPVVIVPEVEEAEEVEDEVVEETPLLKLVVDEDVLYNPPKLIEEVEEVLDVEEEQELVTASADTHSIFAGSDEEWDYDAEVEARSKPGPYVLHKDEFTSSSMMRRDILRVPLLTTKLTTCFVMKRTSQSTITAILSVR
jgi:hypothetical protein